MDTRRFGVVKFFGPARDIHDRLWGYVDLIAEPRAMSSVRVSEPEFGHERIPDGTVVVVEVTEGSLEPLDGRRRSGGGDLKLESPTAWMPNTAGVCLLLGEIQRSLAETGTVPEPLRKLVYKIPASDLPVDLLPFRSDRQIAESVRGNADAIVAAVKDSLGAGRVPTWIHQCAGDPVLSGEHLVEISRMLGSERFEPELAERFAAMSQELSRGELGEVIQANRRWAFALAPYASVEILRQLVELLPQERRAKLAKASGASGEMRSSGREHVVLDIPLLFEALPPADQLRVVIGAAQASGMEKVLQYPGAEAVATLIDTVDLEPLKYIIGLAPAELVLNFPGLLSIGGSGAIGLCATALRSTTKHDLRTEPYLTYLEDLFREWRGVPTSMALTSGATAQAEVLLLFHPSIARRLLRAELLFPEVAHAVGCADDLSCCAKGELGERFGHATAAAAAASLRGLREYKSVASRLASMFAGLDALPTPESSAQERRAEEAIVAIADDIAPMLIDRALRQRIGEVAKVLPRCPVGEAPFCEGKPPSGDFTEPFCPRTKKGCRHGVVEPSRRRDIADWSIMEVLDTAGVSQKFDLHGRTLVNTVAGWVNRLIELEDKMICDECGAPLSTDPNYSAKFTARYSATVMTCSRRCGARAVYFSHCFHCKGIIDSRQSRYLYTESENSVVLPERGVDRRGDALYLCIRCANDLKPWCPKCGSAVGETPDGRAQRTCKTCGHTVDRGTRAHLGKVSLTFDHAPWEFLTHGGQQHAAWANVPSAETLRFLAGEQPWRSTGSDYFGSPF